MTKQVITAAVFLVFAAHVLQAQSTVLSGVPDTHATASPEGAPVMLETPARGASFVLPTNREAGALPAPRVTLAPEHEYVLEELLQIAESANPATAIARANARNARLGERTAASTYLPAISASALGAYQGVNGQNGALGTTVGNSGNAVGSVEAVSLNWLLFDFGGRKGFDGALKNLSSASDILSTGVSQQIAYTVSVAYYNYVASDQRRGTASDALRNAEEIEGAAQGRYEQGQGTILEVAQARDLVAQANFALVTADGFEQQAYATLLTAMGLSPLQTMRIAHLEHRAISDEEAASVEVIVRDALARRPDVLAAYNELLSSKAAVKAAEAQNRPKVFLSATGAYVSGKLGITAVPPIGEQLPTLNISGSQWNGTVLLGASVPIFDGHRRTNAIQKARNDEEKAASTLTQVRLNAMRDVVSAQAALRNSIAANRAAASLKGTARILYDSTLDAYRQGVGTVTASVEAETHLFQATLTEEDAYTSALAAGAKLALAMGTLELPSH